MSGANNGQNATEQLKDKRDGIELAMTFLSNAPQAKAITDCFVTELQETLLAMLSPELNAEQTMYQKQRALAVLSALERMGLKMNAAKEMTTARVARAGVGQSLRIPITGRDED